MEVDVSFVVIAYNEASNIAATLSAITSLSDIGNYEIIVVNDGSTDQTGCIVADCAIANAAVRLIGLSQNSGRGYARSTGVAAARGRLIATIDADIRVPADWLVRARAALVGHDAVGGTAIPDGDAAYLYRKFQLQAREVGHATTVTGSNALYRRELFESVSFDQRLRDGEDVALNHAIQRSGLQARTVPGLLVLHTENKTFLASLRWLFVSGKGATRQLIRYRQVRQPDIVAIGFIGMLIAGLAVASVGYPLIGIALPLVTLLAASLEHVRTRFESNLRDLPRLIAAAVTDCAMLSAYFAGRVLGLTSLRNSLGPRTATGRGELHVDSRHHGPEPDPVHDRG